MTAVPDATAYAARLGSGEKRQTSNGVGSTSTESRTSQLTDRIQNVLASVRREPLARGFDQSQQHPDGMEPETPRLCEALRRPGRTLSPDCPSPVPELGRAACPSCPNPDVPARQLSEGGPSGASTPLESWHDPTGQLRSGSLSRSGLSKAFESYGTARTALTSSSSRDKTRARSNEMSVRDFSIRVADTSSLCSTMTEAEHAVWDGAAPSDVEDLSDVENTAIEDARRNECDSASEKDLCVPACLERGPVQIQISVQHAQVGTAQHQRRQHVSVRLYVTEVLDGVGYVAPGCGPEPVLEGGSPGDHPLDLEWLRHVHVERARHYLMDVAGAALLHPQPMSWLPCQQHICSQKCVRLGIVAVEKPALAL